MSKLPSSPIGKNIKARMSFFKKNKKNKKEKLKDIYEYNEQELNDRFEKLLDDMNIPMETRQSLREKDAITKLTMLDSVKTVNTHSPDHYVALLKQIINNRSSMSDEKIIENLESVRISLNSCPVSWMKTFNEAENDGLNVLISVLNVLHNFSEASVICLKCIRAFANCGYGLLRIIASDEALLNIAMCLQPHNASVMVLAVEFLTVLAFFNAKTHMKILEVLYKAAKLNNFEARFVPLIEGAKNYMPNEQESLSLACSRFINILINPNFKVPNNPPLDLYYRLHLRREFINYGLLKVFDNLKRRRNIPLIHEQINKFFEDNEFEELESQDKAEVLLRSFDDCDDIFRLIKATIYKTSTEPLFRSILGTLLIIKDDPLRDNIYNFIDKIIIEIVVQNEDDFCHDPTLRQFTDISLRKIYEGDNNEDNVDELKKQLESEKFAKEELQMKLQICKSSSGKRVANKGESTFNFEASASTAPAIQGPLEPVSGPPPPPQPPQPPPPPPSALGVAIPAPPVIGAPPPPPGMSAISKPPDVFEKFGIKRVVFKPPQPMKKANWNKINQATISSKSFWLTIKEESIEDDILNELQESFATKPSLENSTIVKAIFANQKSKELKVLDGKTAQNISILLGSLRIDSEKLTTAILEIDTSIITSSMLEQLVKSLPEAEEMKKFVKLSDADGELSDAEKFCQRLSSIRNLKTRLESIIFKMNFNSKILLIKQQYFDAQNAINDISSSSCLKKILELTLSIGNYMNSGSRNQQSIGFELGFLTKLSDTKDKMNKMSLVQFLAQVIAKKYFDPMDINEELSSVEKAVNFSGDFNNSNLLEMKKEVSSIENQLTTFKLTSKHDKFFEIFDPFVDEVKEEICLAEGFQAKVNSSFQSLVEFLSLNNKTYKIEDLFSDISIFKRQFLKAHLENEELRALEEKARKSKLELMKTDKNKIEPKETSEEDGGVIDTLFEALKSGDAFGSRPTKKKFTGKTAKTNRIVNRTRSRRDFNEVFSQIPLKSVS